MGVAALGRLLLKAVEQRAPPCGFERSPWQGRVSETGLPFRGLARLCVRTHALGRMLGANERQEAHNDEDCQYATHGVLYLATNKALCMRVPRSFSVDQPFPPGTLPLEAPLPRPPSAQPSS